MSIFYLGLIVLAGCQMPASYPSPSPYLDKVLPSETEGPSGLGLSSPTPLILTKPVYRAVYYLSGDPNNPQIWRVLLDDASTQQITNTDPPGIDDFDINPVTGEISLVFNNNLFILSPENNNKPFSESRVDLPGESDVSLRSPRWSPDGANLAVGFGGILLYQNDTKISKMVLADLADGTTYEPYSWSPDGTALLVSIRQAAAGTLGVLSVSNGKLKILQQEPVCCQATWTMDSRSVIIANPYWRVAPAGLSLFDWMNEEKKILISPQSSDGTYNSVGWPNLNQDGSLSFLYANSPTLPETLPPLSMVRINIPEANNLDASSKAPLRTETLTVNEVLWSKDGNQAVIVQPPPGKTGFPLAGPVILIPAGEGPVLPLAASGYNLRWGP